MTEVSTDVSQDALADGDSMSTSELQALLERAVRAYSARAEENPSLAPLAPDHGVTETDVLRCVSALLASVGVELFELAAWQLWSPQQMAAGR